MKKEKNNSCWIQRKITLVKILRVIAEVSCRLVSPILAKNWRR